MLTTLAYPKETIYGTLDYVQPPSFAHKYYIWVKVLNALALITTALITIIKRGLKPTLVEPPYGTIRLGCRGLEVTNALVCNTVVNYDRKKFYNTGI
jgi:hypothetical protein